MSMLRTTSIAMLAGLFVVVVCSAQEKKIKRSDLPPAVEKAVAEVSKGATIRDTPKKWKTERRLTKWK